MRLLAWKVLAIQRDRWHRRQAFVDKPGWRSPCCETATVAWRDYGVKIYQRPLPSTAPDVPVFFGHRRDRLAGCGRDKSGCGRCSVASE